MNNKSISLLKDGILIITGIFSAAFGLKGFLMSSHFIDGGVTGVSMLISSLSGASLAILIPVINLPFIIMGYRHIGKEFALKSTLAIAGLAIVLGTVSFPDVTPDLLLTSVFGGFFIGAGIGITMRGGAVLDGTEVAALLISRSNLPLGVGEAILLLNVIIFSTAAYFLGADIALYSMITYFAASKTIDFIVHGIEEYTAIMIISEYHDEIVNKITKDLKKGITVFNTEQGYGNHSKQSPQTKALYCVVTRLEIGKVRAVVSEIDPQAFIIQYPIDEVKGGKVKGRPLH